MTQLQEKIASINKEKYEDLNGRSVISVTKLADYVGEPFDKLKTAQSCELKGKNDPLYKYAGMTAEQIIEEWDAKATESRLYGDLLDSYTEQVFEKSEQEREIWKLDNNFDTDMRLKNNCMGFEQFKSDILAAGFEYAGREISVYGECPHTHPGNMPFDKEIEELPDLVIGRIDCLFYNPEKETYLIVDWKTTDEIKDHAFRNKKMKGPAHEYEDCDLSKYIIQVQTYKNDLIKYGIAPAEKIVVCICNLRKEPEPNGKLYRLYKENVAFSSETLDSIVNFSIKKRKLIKAISNGTTDF